MKRRDFLKTGLSAAALSAIAPMGLFGSSDGSSTTKKLVVVFNYGGNDGVNMLVPYGDPDYKRRRPTIHIPSPNEENTTDREAALHLGDKAKLNGEDFFGLHPAMTELKKLWDEDNVAFVPATHCGPNPNRSHFYQFNFLGYGKYNGQISDNQDGFGWVGRYMRSKYTYDKQDIRTFDFTAGYFNVFSGWDTMGMSNPSSIYYGMSQTKAESIISKVQNLEKRDDDSQEAKRSAMLDFTKGKLDELESAGLPTSGKTVLDRQLQQTLGLLRDKEELEIVFLNLGGWDTHADQLNRQQVLLKDLSDSIGHFYDSMDADEKNNITTLVLGEFGRTCYENASTPPGTDHGHAFCSIAIGGSVKGGIYGEWPGLNDDRFLQERVDYRNVIAEALSMLDTGNPEDAFQNYTREAIGFAG